MGDPEKKAALWKLVRSITNWETRQMLSSKPFKPCAFDIMLSEVAPHFYSEQETLQIKNLHKKLLCNSQMETTAVLQWGIRKRRGANRKRRSTLGTEELDALKPAKKKSRKEMTLTNVQDFSVELKKLIAEKEKEIGELVLPVIEKRRIETEEEALDTEELLALKPAKEKSRKETALANMQDFPAEFTNPIAEEEEIKEVVVPMKKNQRIETLHTEEEALKPAKKKKSSSRKKIVSETVQDLPVAFTNRIAEMNGGKLQFVMSKKLYETDVKANNNRLSMPENKIKDPNDFLSEPEKESTTRGNGIEVTVLDPHLREFSLQLKKWNMNNVWVYNLIKNWNRVVLENQFKKDHELQIWSFRVDTKLYFVLNKV